MPLYYTQDGKTARPVNPFEQYGDDMATAYMEFEATVQSYPLTTELKPGSGFSGEVVKRVRSRNPQTKEWEAWAIVNDEAYSQIPNDHYYWEKQEAIAPSTAIEKPVEAAFDYETIKERNEAFKPIARRYETGKIGFYDALVESHNAAIDEAVKKLHTGLFVSDEAYDYAVNTINQLRK